MASHHFIGTGLLSRNSGIAGLDHESVLAELTRRAENCGLRVMAERSVEFDNGGATYVCVLAESHLVVHLWTPEGYATVDLHVCDYREDNAPRAEELKKRLEEFCFESGTASWRELSLAPLQFNC